MTNKNAIVWGFAMCHCLFSQYDLWECWATDNKLTSGSAEKQGRPHCALALSLKVLNTQNCTVVHFPGCQYSMNTVTSCQEKSYLNCPTVRRHIWASSGPCSLHLFSWLISAVQLQKTTAISIVVFDVCISSELLTLNIDPGTHTIKSGTRSEHDLGEMTKFLELVLSLTLQKFLKVMM